MNNEIIHQQLQYQAQLGLDVTPSYYSRWLKVQFPRLREFCVTRVGFNAGQFLPSINSLAKQAVENPRAETEHWSCSTGALLAILARWATTLHESSRERAVDLLNMIFGLVLNDKSLFLFACVRKLADYVPHSPLEDDSVRVCVDNGLVDLQPLVAKYAFFRKWVKASTKVVHVGETACMRLPQLLVMLVREGVPQSLALFASIATCVSLHIERHPMCTEMDTNHLSLPVHKGAKRTRRISFVFKAVVCAEANQSAGVGRSERQVVALIQRLSKFAIGMKAEAALKWVGPEAARYYVAAKTLMTAAPWQFLHVAADGTRLGGVDVFCTLIYAYGLRACWAIPKVLGETFVESWRPSGVSPLVAGAPGPGRRTHLVKSGRRFCQKAAPDFTKRQEISGDSRRL